LYAAEWPCCHDPLRFSLGSDDLSPQRGNPTRRTPNACSLAHFSLASRAPAARLPLSWGGAVRTERTHAAARAWREGLCVMRTRPHALCVPRPFAFLFDRLSPGSPWRRFRLSSAFRLLLKPFIFSTPLAGVAFSDFRRFPRTRREGLCAFHLSFSQPLWQARNQTNSTDTP
jgi:hypothetical protein